MATLVNEIRYQFYKRIVYYLVWKRFYMCQHTKYLTKEPPSKTILLIRPDHIGDFVLWLDQAKEYRKGFPEHKIVLLCSPGAAEIAKCTPYFDEILLIIEGRTSDKKYMYGLLQQVNRYYYDKVIYPSYGRAVEHGDWIVHNTRAKEKIAFEYPDGAARHITRIPGNKKKLVRRLDSWYTRIVHGKEEVLMELERNAEFGNKVLPHKYTPYLPLFPFEVPQISKIPFSQYAVFVMGAFVPKRRWPVEKFAAVARQIFPLPIVLCGAEQEAPLVKEFVSLVGSENEKYILNIVGQTSELELVSAIKYATFLLGNDTGTAHIAVATRTPSVCLYGGGHYGRFFPYHVDNIKEEDKRVLPHVVTIHNHSCFGCDLFCRYPLVHGCWPCCYNIEVDDALDAVNAILSTQN